MERFKTSPDYSKNVIFVLRTPGGNFVDVSRSAVEMLGYRRDELLRMSIFDFVPPDTASRLVECFSHLDSADEDDREEVIATTLRRKNGEHVPVDVTLRFVSLPDGWLCAVAVALDLTQCDRAVEALMESEERHRALIESSSDAILMMDKECRIISCNRVFLDLFYFDSHDFVEGKSFRILHPSEESFQSFKSKAIPALDATGAFMVEWELIRTDGSRFPAEVTISAIRNADGSIKGYVATVRDVTRRKKAEDEVEKHRLDLEEMVQERTRDLEAAQKALIQREKLKTLGAISAEVAHEIRNPLVVIGGFARRLQKKHPEIPEVGIILDESRRLERILERIKDYLRPIEMKPQECSVNNVVTESVRQIADEMERENVVWQLDLDPVIPPAYVDPQVLMQIVINLIRNAVGIMDKSGILTIKTYAGERDIRIDFRNPVLELNIKDPEFLFLPFDEYGQGIGVPFCYRLVKEMGGMLSFTQEQNCVIFTVSLPKDGQNTKERKDERVGS